MENWQATDIHDFYVCRQNSKIDDVTKKNTLQKLHCSRYLSIFCLKGPRRSRIIPVETGNDGPRRGSGSWNETNIQPQS